MICLSAVYRQDVAADEERHARDPENRTWWRRMPRRLEAEAVRDAILQVSGRLRHDGFGKPSVKLPIPREAIISRLGEAYTPTASEGPLTWRRSIYTFRKRTVPVPFLQTFDAPGASDSCGQRVRTTVANQALFFMNDEFVRSRSEDFARRVMKSESPIQDAFLLALGRLPSDREDEEAAKFILDQQLLRAGDKKEAWTDFCQLLFGLNEFSYID